MSTTINELLQLGTALGNCSSEVEWRSGASRAYYALFHKALEVADSCLPPNPFHGGEHTRLTDRFVAHSFKGKSLAYRLIDMKKVRTLADYKLAYGFSQQEALDLVAACPILFKQADDFETYARSGASAASAGGSTPVGPAPAKP